MELSSEGNERVATTSHCASLTIVIVLNTVVGLTEGNSIGDTDRNDDGTLVFTRLVEGVILGSLGTVGYPEGISEDFAVEGVLDSLIDGEVLTVLVGKLEGNNGLCGKVHPTGELDSVINGEALTVLVGYLEGISEGFAVEGVLDSLIDGEALTVLVRKPEGTP